MPLRPGETPIAAVPNLEEVLFPLLLRRRVQRTGGDTSVSTRRPTLRAWRTYRPCTAPAGTTRSPRMRRSSSSRCRNRTLPPNASCWVRGTTRACGGAVRRLSATVDFGGAAKWGDEVYNRLRLRWFDRWLKDMDNGVDEDPPVRIFVMGGDDGRMSSKGRYFHGGEWRFEQEWPLKRAESKALYLRSGGELSDRPGGDGDPGVSWEHNPESPVPTVSGNVTGFHEWVKVPEELDPAYVPQRARMRSLVYDGSRHQKETPDSVGARPPYLLLVDREDVVAFQTTPARRSDGGDRTNRGHPVGLVVRPPIPTSPPDWSTSALQLTAILRATTCPWLTPYCG